MDLARLLYARVMAVHEVLGAPVEPFDEFAVGDWDFHSLGGDGVLGIKRCPDQDGDALVVALPSDHSPTGGRRVVRLMRRHLATGRKLYTMAWKDHILAVNINLRMGAQAFGQDGDGFIHFIHTAEGLDSATSAGRQPLEEKGRGEKEHA